MKSTERRRYFRVDDEVILAWRTLTHDEKEKRMKQFMMGEMEYPDPTRLYLTLESDITAIIQNLNPRQPELASVLKMLNRKINLVARGAPMSASRGSLLEETPQQVNISACGIAFMVEEELKKGQNIQIEMVLVPEQIYILSYGTVIGCELISHHKKNKEDRPYRINVDFVAMREDDMDRLIQHIMQKELEMIKSRKKESGTK